MRVASASACARGPGLRSHGRRRLRRCSVLPSNKQEAAAFTPDAALELLLSQPATGTLLTLVLEWATQEALQARAKGHPTSNLTQHLYAHLGEEMLDAQCSVPALLLRPLCYPHSALDYRQLVEAAIRLLRARFAWRRMAMRQLLVCVTWDGAITDISTANVSDGEVIELTQLLALSDDALATKIADLTMDRPGLTPHVRTLNAFQDSKWAFDVQGWTSWDPWERTRP